MQQVESPTLTPASNISQRYYKPSLVDGCVKNSTTKKAKRSTPVRTYDESALYHLFCVFDGKIEQMLDHREHLSPEHQKMMPKRAALYRLARRNNWRAHHAKLKEAMRKEMMNEVALTYARIDKMSRLILKSYSIWLARIDAGEIDNTISYKDLELAWKMSRTERGLPTNIKDDGSYSRSKSKSVVDPLTYFEQQPEPATGRNEILDYLNSLPPDTSNEVEGSRMKSIIVPNINGCISYKGRLIKRRNKLIRKMCVV